MKILILSTFGHYGGAATCSKRLYLALKKHGLDVDLRVAQFYDQLEIRPLFRDSLMNRIRTKILFILERLQVLFILRNLKYLYKFSTGSVGFELSKQPLIQQADIIHLHWINFGFVSIREIGELAKKKPVLWTQHDMWAFSGGFHYTCYQENFGKSPASEQIQAAKMKYWKRNSLKVSATSSWLANCARESQIFKGWKIDVLPTPIDTSVFRPLDHQEMRNKYGLPPDDFYVLFGAVDLGDERKGFRYLLEALRILESKMPGMHLITFGHQKADLFNGKLTNMGQIDSTEKLNEIYNLADVFVQPSIQDNLPNTVMEAMSCGVPVVAFDSGGVSEMVEHKENGFLATNKHSKMLADGILYFTDEQQRKEAGSKARKKIEITFSEEVLVPKYQELYSHVIKDHL